MVRKRLMALRDTAAVLVVSRRRTLLPRQSSSIAVPIATASVCIVMRVV